MSYTQSEYHSLDSSAKTPNQNHPQQRILHGAFARDQAELEDRETAEWKSETT